MTRIEAIHEADRLKPNAYSAAEKLRWLERLEERVREEILLRSEAGAETAADAFTGEEPERPLQIPAPYDEMYIHWLCAQMDYCNGETEGFNAANAMFEAVYGRFRNAWNRTHRPLTGEKRYF